MVPPCLLVFVSMATSEQQGRVQDSVALVRGNSLIILNHSSVISDYSMSLCQFKLLSNCCCSPAPPTAVRNLGVESSSETEVVVRWDAPDEPGRTDYYYSVSRSIPGDLINFQTLNDRLKNTASTVTFVVTNLVPFTAYIIRVSVHNGVSQNNSANDQLREVTASTNEGSEFSITVKRI